MLSPWKFLSRFTSRKPAIDPDEASAEPVAASSPDDGTEAHDPLLPVATSEVVETRPLSQIQIDPEDDSHSIGVEKSVKVDKEPIAERVRSLTLATQVVITPPPTSDPPSAVPASLKTSVTAAAKGAIGRPRNQVEAKETQLRPSEPSAFVVMVALDEEITQLRAELAHKLAQQNSLLRKMLGRFG